MIAHVVLFTPRASLDDAQRHAILDALISAMEQFAMVRRCRIGRRLRHGLPGYEQAMKQDYEYLLILEFESAEGLREYLQHPAHARIGGFFTDAAETSLAYDYEMLSLDDAPGVL